MPPANAEPLVLTIALGGWSTQPCFLCPAMFREIVRSQGIAVPRSVGGFG